MSIELIGPFEYKFNKVAVDGCVVPNVTITHIIDDVHELVFDNRFSVQGNWSIMQDYIWIIAQVQAVSAGYTHHGKDSKRSNPFAVQAMIYNINPLDKAADIVELYPEGEQNAE